MDYKIYFGIAIVLVLVLLYCRNRSETFESSDSLDQSGDQEKYKLILYYTNWCGWSQKFLPTWDKLQEQVKDVEFVKIDCEKDKELCQNVPGFPFLILEKTSPKKVEYKGDRSIEDVLRFLEKNMEKKA